MPGSQTTGYRSQASTGDGRYKFTSKERDTETRDDYFGTRYYDSWLGRWLQVDPLADESPDVSPYVYCNDNPVSILDLFGMDTTYYLAPKPLPEILIDIQNALGGN